MPCARAYEWTKMATAAFSNHLMLGTSGRFRTRRGTGMSSHIVNLISTVLSGVALAFFADFGRRALANGPDALGALGIAVTAALAGGALTTQGKALVKAVLGNFCITNDSAVF